MFPKRLTRELVQTAMELQKRRLWERFTNFDCFAVRVPGEDDPLLASVMGDGGEEHGLMLLRGPNAVDTFMDLIQSDGPFDDAAEAMDMLGFSMDRFSDLARDARAIIRRSGRQPDSKESFPNFLVKRPNRHVRTPQDDELMLLLRVLKAVVSADARGLLVPAKADDASGVCVITLEDSPTDPAVSVARERLARGSVVAKPAVFAASGVDLSGMKRLVSTWLVGTPWIPVREKNDDRSSLLLLVADGDNGMVLKAEPFFSDETHEQVQCLVDTFRSKGLPSSILFASRPLYEALKGVMQKAGVTCHHRPSDPRFAEVTKDFLDVLGEEAPMLTDHLEDEPQDDTVPARDDLAGWKQADHRLAQRFAKHLVNGDRPYSPRAIKRYFGDDDIEHYMREHEQRGVVMAYSSWCMLDYRPTRNSKTQAQKMLAEGLPQAQAMLLRARIEAHPSLYRVAGHDPGAGTVEVEDVLLGGAVTVYDRLLSENIDNGLFLTARVFPAGRFHFFDVIGPPLGAAMGMEAVAFLQDCGMHFTTDGQKRHAHMFGWLWNWFDQWKANWRPPHLCNTDGDDLLLHTASFSLADPDATRRALLKRKDIDFDEGADEFVWSKSTGRGVKMLGGPVTLARIELLDDELVLTANSAKRFAKARKWLTKMPGVTFNDVAISNVDDIMKNRPPDDQMTDAQPFQVAPEHTDSLQVQINQQYMEWLDTALPLLKGKTPRQACRTPQGQQQAARMIRTIPDPTGNVPLGVPRREMLCELGLPAGTTLPIPPPEPIVPPASVPSTKVGRNEPCPCGSGRKYKKCCGR